MEDIKERLVSNGISYIAIEGNVGAGKTTLARLLAEETGARLFLEEVDDNPFIERFYEDMAGYSFQAQIFFLLNRYRQQVEIAQQDLFADLLVADYLFARDKIYAHAVLGDDELVLYNRLHSLLEGKVACPDLVIYLQASSEVLLQRIRKRGRSFEKDISEEYLNGLNEAFNHFFFHYHDSPLLIINTDQIDFTSGRDQLEDFFLRISEKFEGTRCYVPSWERD
ncbi:MAG: deoxynucleoside kinase [Candidatus Krumholzibacteriota bacterium]|nr:deoxynucleoside kinase [Candidatus Krumholzibacteriota bacterium]